MPNRPLNILHDVDVLSSIDDHGRPHGGGVEQRDRGPELQGADRRRRGPAPEHGVRRGLDQMSQEVFTQNAMHSLFSWSHDSNSKRPPF